MKELFSLSLSFLVGFSSFASPSRRELNAWLARDLAAAGIVLLENKDSALPLKADEEIALVGITGYFCHRMGWGSGDMLAHDPVQIDAGLEKAGVKIDADFAKLYRDDLAKRDYSRLNGDYCATTYDLMTGVLREEWGFDGFVMTDWWNSADKLRHAEAGNDLVMPGVRGEYAALVAALKDGKVRRADVQHAAANILKTYVRISLARKR